MLAIYTRLSREDEQSNSINNQLREGKEFAEANNFPNFKHYNEGEGVSGTLDAEERPKLIEMLSDIRKGAIKAVWMRNANRLDRNTATFYLFVGEVKKANISVYFGNSDRLDYNDPTTLLQATIMSGINQYQAQLQSYQTKRSLLDNIKEGKASGRVLPYGYKSDENGFLVIDEEERKVIEKIFEMSLEGKGQRTITRWLNTNNIPTRYNKYIGTLAWTDKYTGKEKVIDKKEIRWAGKVIHDIIKNPIYKGQRRWGKEFYDAPAIFSEEYWKKVNDNLEKNRNNSGKNVEHKYLLKGLLRCAKCGRNYYGRSRTNDPKGYKIRKGKDGKVRKDYNMYTCSSKRYSELNCGSKDLKLVELEALIWGVLFKENSLVEKIKDFLMNTDVKSLQDEKRNVLKGLLEQKNGFERGKKNLIDAVVRGVISDEDIVGEMNSIKANIATINEKIQFEKKNLVNLENSERIMNEKIQDLQSIKNNLSFSQKKEITHTFIKEIVLYTNLPEDETKNFVQVNVEYKGEMLEKDKFLFSLDQGIAINLFNQKIVTLYHIINKKGVLEELKPYIENMVNVQ